MNIFVLPAIAMAGGAVGAALHEGIHYALARRLGTVVGAGWSGGVAGGPFIDYRVGSRWRSELVRKGPLALGVLGAIALAASFDGLTLPWLFGGGVVAGLLWTSPEDLFAAVASQPDKTQETA